MSEQHPPQPPAGQQPPYAGGPGQPPYAGGPGQPPQGPPPQPGYGYGYPAPPPPGVYAEWGQRVVATLWDFVYTLPAWILTIIGAVLLVIGGTLESENDDGAAFLLIGGLLLLAGMLLGLFLTVKNLILRQGRTGYTWGKSKVGIRVVREVDGQPCGAWSAVARMVLHSLINQVFYIDYLWPLWDDRNQTLTDKVLGTVVINQPER